MEAIKHRPWRVSIHAKARSLKFKFRARNIFSGLGGQPTGFSFLLTLRRFFFKLEAETGGPTKKSIKWLPKTSILKFLRKFLIGPAGSKPVTGKESSNPPSLPSPENSSSVKRPGGLLSQEPMPAIAGNVALLSSSVSQKDHGGIAIYALTLLFYLILLVKSYLTKRSHLPLLLVASMASSIGFYLTYLNYKGHIAKIVWKAWNHATLFGCLYVLSQVVFSRFYFGIERKKSLGFLISAVLPFLFYQALDCGGLSKGAQSTATEAASAWIANFLLLSQSFSSVLANPADLKTLASFISSARFLVKDMANIVAHWFST